MGDNKQGEIILMGVVAALAVAPLIAIYQIFKGVKRLYTITYCFFGGTNQTTPPLNKEQKSIFKRGLHEYVNEGKIIKHSIVIRKS